MTKVPKEKVKEPHWKLSARALNALVVLENGTEDEIIMLKDKWCSSTLSRAFKSIRYAENKFPIVETVFSTIAQIQIDLKNNYEPAWTDFTKEITLRIIKLLGYTLITNVLEIQPNDFIATVSKTKKVWHKHRYKVVSVNLPNVKATELDYTMRFDSDIQLKPSNFLIGLRKNNPDKQFWFFSKRDPFDPDYDPEIDWGSGEEDDLPF